MTKCQLKNTLLTTTLSNFYNIYCHRKESKTLKKYMENIVIDIGDSCYLILKENLKRVKINYKSFDLMERPPILYNKIDDIKISKKAKSIISKIESGYHPHTHEEDDKVKNHSTDINVIRDLSITKKFPIYSLQRGLKWGLSQQGFKQILNNETIYKKGDVLELNFDFPSSWSTNSCVSLDYSMGYFGLVLKIVVNKNDVLYDSRVIENYGPYGKTSIASENEVVLKQGKYMVTIDNVIFDKRIVKDTSYWLKKDDVTKKNIVINTPVEIIRETNIIPDHIEGYGKYYYENNIRDLKIVKLKNMIDLFPKDIFYE